MRTFIVDEGIFTLTSDALSFQANGMGITQGLPARIQIPYNEIVNIESRPDRPNDGGVLAFTLLKDNFTFNVNYSKADRLQAIQFVDIITKWEAKPPAPTITKPNFSGIGREPTRGEKRALVVAFALFGAFAISTIWVLLAGPPPKNVSSEKTSVATKPIIATHTTKPAKTTQQPKHTRY